MCTVILVRRDFIDELALSKCMNKEGATPRLYLTLHLHHVQEPGFTKKLANKYVCVQG